MSNYTAGLDEAAAKAARAELRSSVRVVERIIEVLKKDQDGSVKAMRGQDRFELACWSEKAAYELGKQAQAQIVIDMLNQALKEKLDVKQ